MLFLSARLRWLAPLALLSLATNCGSDSTEDPTPGPVLAESLHLALGNPSGGNGGPQ